MRDLRCSAYFFVAFGLVLLPIASCSRAPDYWAEAKPGQKRVLVSFPPLFSFAHAVAGDDAFVLCQLTTNGPHEYEGTQMDVFKVNHADLLVYNGLTLDDTFVDKMLRNHKNRKLTTLNVGAALVQVDKKLPNDKKLIISGEPIKHQHADGTWHVHGAEDPHYWLAPTRAKAATDLIAAKLAEIDPAHADSYTKRAADYKKKLDDLIAHGQAAFANKKNRKLIAMHESLRYLEKDFDLKIMGSIQDQPGADADAKRVVDLIDLCKKEDVRVIAKEPQYSGAQPATIADALKRKGIEVAIIEIDPLETAPISGQHGKYNPDPDFYVNKMRENIDTLAKALP